MLSPRHNEFLDAARECIQDVGWSRATLTDVARRADVSRMTIYRAWPDMRTLVSDLITREWSEMVGAVPVPADAEPTAETIATVLLAAIREMRANPLLRRILEVDPEIVLPYLLERRGRSQQAILGFLAPLLAAGQAAGHVRPGDPELLARTVVLAAHGPALSAHTMTDPDGLQVADLDEAFVDLVARGIAR